MPLPCVWTAKVKARASQRRYIEISSSGRIRQNPWVCNHRYRRRCSTCLAVLSLPRPFREDRVPAYRRLKRVWILFLRERPAEYFCHLMPIPSIIHNLKLLPRLLARSIAAPIRVPFPRDVAHHSYGSRPRTNHMCFRNEGITVALLRIRQVAPLGSWRSASLVHGGLSMTISM